MGRDVLVRRINRIYKENGRTDDWTYRNFHELYEINALAHFRIFDIHWFPGASMILELVDRLHTIMTPKEDFIEIAQMLGVEINPKSKKQTIAEVVKKDPNWRAKAFDLELKRKHEARLRELQPVFDFLVAHKLQTNELPRQQDNNKWSINVETETGAWDTVYLIEKENDVIFDSLYQGRIGVLKDHVHLFRKKL